LKKQKLLYLIIILTSWSGNIWCQDNTSDMYAYAQHLESIGQSKGALKEYLRSYYYNNKNSQSALGVARSFEKVADFNNAIKYYDLYAFGMRTNDSVREEIAYKKFKLYLALEEEHKALATLLLLPLHKIQDKDRYYFYLTLNQLLLNKHDDAYVSVKKISYSAYIDTSAFFSIIKKLDKNQEKNPKHAKYMSMIIPGLGQALNGEVQDGLKSLAVYTAFGLLFLDQLQKTSFVDATTAVGPWWVRYYMGGIKNAEKAATNTQQNKKKRLIASLINQIQAAKNHVKH
jgi:hypothetical protein